MRLVPVHSSMISAVGYNPDSETCCVQFHTGKVYKYSGVPADVFVSVITDQESHGKAFNTKIKGGTYPYQEVTLADVKSL